MPRLLLLAKAAAAAFGLVLYLWYRGVRNAPFAKRGKARRRAERRR